MKKNEVFFLILILSVLYLDLAAQPVPVDPAIRTGKLENGLTYYIRHNEEPKERASFYIIQNVGAILEEDNQNGLAHFLEHMAFNGTKHFPGKGIINTLEKYGVAFGENINAFTAHTETVYNISDVPSTNEGLVDTCLLVLHDWSDFLLLTDEEIDRERGVISEEWRTCQNFAFRMQKIIQPVLFKGSKYAIRDIIGNPDVIRTFKPETLRKFYKDWYRTDLQAIAVVGDIDVDRTESKIKNLFGSLSAEQNPPALPFVEIPGHIETYFVEAADPEATSFAVIISLLHKAVTPGKKDLTYYREQLIVNLFNRIMSDRISELLQKGEPPFATGTIRYGRQVRGYDNLGITANAKPGKMDEALRAIYTEAQRVYRHGITPTELERAKSNLLTQTENVWKQKDKIKNDQYLDAITEHFLTNEPLESIDTRWDLTQQLLPSVTAEELSMKIRQWIVPENRVIAVMGPQSSETKMLSEQEALAIMEEVEKSDIDPWKDDAVSTSLIDRELKGSPVVNTRQLPEFRAVEWTLANHAKVVFRFADFQKDNVILHAISPGGMSLNSPDQLASAMMATEFAGFFGAGKWDATTLKKMLTGKIAAVSPALAELNEAFSGNCSPKDFETMMQLLYLKFEQPRFDEEAFNALKSRYVAMIANINKNPQKIMSDSLQMILSCYHPRTRVVNPAFFDEVSLDKIEQVYRDRFADAGDFTFFIVGNIGEEQARMLAEKYIGSLSDLPRTETWTDHQVKFPEGKTIREIMIPLQTKKATVTLIYNNQSKWSPVDNMKMNVVRDVLKLRYTEEIREKEGGTYDVSVSAQNEKFPVEEKTLQMNFDTDTAKAGHLKSILYQEIDKLIKKGPSAEDLDKTVKNLLKEREQAKPNNGYWMNTLATWYRYGINPDLPGNYENILQTMTVKDVRKFAGKYFKKADVADIVFLPQE